MAAGTDRFGAFIRQKREAKGLSLREMARKIKVSPTFLSKVETENWKPGEEKLHKIAEVIGCDSDDLFSRAGRVPTELSDIIIQSPGHAALLREARGLSDEQIQKVRNQIRSLKKK
jgi:HTH-type transcriptional regulator, competence development regulator